METFSTVLFVNEAPVGYSVQRSSDRMELNPAENPNRKLEPPHIIAEKREGTWKVSGTDDANLIQQVLDEVGIAERGVVGPALSAAP